MQEIYKLSEKITKNISQKEINELKKLMIPYQNGSIALVQLNPIVGDIEYNAKKIIKYIKLAEQIGIEIIAFPELSLMGYPIEDTIDRHPVIVQGNVKWLNEIAKLVKNTTAIIGFVEPRKETTGKQFYNSLAIIENGKIKDIVRKILLPTYSEFNDYRYIEPAKENKIQIINNKKYGISICEDCWNDTDFFDNKVLYQTNPIYELFKEKPDVFINCSASPSRTKKEQLKHNMLSFISKKYNTPFIYVNQVGAIDNISFDGGSRVYDNEGKLLARAKYFEEQFMIVNPQKSLGKIYDLPKGLEVSLTEQKIYTLEYESDLERTYKTIIQGIRDYFHKNGFKKATLGLSGGLDSSVCAVLLADALGKENVFGVSMPSKITSNESKNDAKELATNLGIKFAEIGIKDIVNTTNETLNPLFNNIDNEWHNRYKNSYTQDNIQARSRAIILWSISNEFGSCLPIATSDKSELYMGYATINGDMSGGFAPIADVCKTKLFSLARWMNKNRDVKNAIPQAIIDKKPGAELAIDPNTGKPLIAEDALMPYEFLDEIIWRIENKKEKYDDMINSDFLYEKKVKVSKQQKKEWLDKFFRRMQNALYKWSILPPSIIVDAHSINKNDYRQPITSNINYKCIKSEAINEILQNS